MQKYFGGFRSVDEIHDEFAAYANSGYSGPREQLPEFPTENEILFAAYEGGSYEGDAEVLYERDGKLFEVQGGHCSCNGLEGQWNPIETDWKTINLRPRDGSFLSSYSYAEATRKAFWELVDSKL
jgi:hypothetical protein